MTRQRWFGVALIVVGAGVLLLAPVAPTTAVVDFPADGGLPAVTDIDIEITPFGMGVLGLAALAIVVGIAVLARRPSP